MKGILFIKMPLGCERRGKKIIQVKTPFDYTLIKNGEVVFIDCKSFDKSRISHSMLIFHQIQALQQIYEMGCNAGYLVHMRDISKVVFFASPKLWLLKVRESLTLKDGQELGDYEDFSLDILFANPTKSLT
jgi:penicillin-binding protein-related factor A (putative recombinase)